MSLIQLELWQIAVLFIPVIFIFWALYDLNQRNFKNITERYYWMLLVTFFPVVGALIYLLFGRKRSTRN